MEMLNFQVIRSGPLFSCVHYLGHKCHYQVLILKLLYASFKDDQNTRLYRFQKVWYSETSDIQLYLTKYQALYIPKKSGIQIHQTFNCL